MSRFDLTIESEDPVHLRPQIEHALRQKGVRYELWELSQDRLRYEVTLPPGRTEKLTEVITRLTGHNGDALKWRLKHVKTVQN